MKQAIIVIILLFLVGCTGAKTVDLDNGDTSNQDDITEVVDIITEDPQEDPQPEEQQPPTTQDNKKANEAFTLATNYYNFTAIEHVGDEAIGTDIYIKKSNKVELHTWRIEGYGTDDAEYVEYLIKQGTYTIKDNILILTLSKLTYEDTGVTEKIAETREFTLTGNNKIEDGDLKFKANKNK